MILDDVLMIYLRMLNDFDDLGILITSPILSKSDVGYVLESVTCSSLPPLHTLPATQVMICNKYQTWHCKKDPFKAGG